MATKHQQLSHFVLDDIPSASNMKFGIVVAEWNSDITENLFNGALNTLIKCGCRKDHIFRKNVPGSFELSLGAQLFLNSTDVDAVICLGSVIKGETKHFDFVCQTTANGIKDVSLKYNKAVIFGVLTDNTHEQAKDRSGGKLGNKGIEAAISAIKMVHLKNNMA